MIGSKESGSSASATTCDEQSVIGKQKCKKGRERERRVGCEEGERERKGGVGVLLGCRRCECTLPIAANRSEKQIVNITKIITKI